MRKRFLVHAILICALGCSESEPPSPQPSSERCEDDRSCDRKADAAVRGNGAAEDAGSGTVAECEELRACCYGMAGTARGDCLAMLASIERGTRPARDCSSTLDGLLEIGRCASAADAGAHDAGAAPEPSTCLATRARCTRNGDCCGFNELAAFCVDTGGGQMCLKSCFNTTPCRAGEVCTPLGAGDNAVCVP